MMNAPWLKSTWNLFNDCLVQQRLAHALLVQGPQGLGKSSLALAMAERLLCTGDGDEACGACRSCRLLKSGAHPDYFFVSREPHPRTGKIRQEIIVEQIRKLITSLQLTTSISPCKLAIIDPAESMNLNAANALLKTLEEPPGTVYLLLVCSDPSRLPITIRSRCQALPVRQASPEQALEWLTGQDAGNSEDAREALEMTAGSPLRALETLQQGGANMGREIKARLAALAEGRAPASQVAADLSDMDADALWLTLSQCIAACMPAAIGGKAPKWMAAGVAPDARRLSELQRQADQNRKLVATPVRQDLLIQDWLLKWTRAGTSAEFREQG
jgi:DNA polymerase-3 subunit delta'